MRSNYATLVEGYQGGSFSIYAAVRPPRKKCLVRSPSPSPEPEYKEETYTMKNTSTVSSCGCNSGVRR